MPQGIFHIASAIFHISEGNISLSRKGKYHGVLRKGIFAIPFGEAFFVGKMRIERGEKGKAMLYGPTMVPGSSVKAERTSMGRAYFFASSTQGWCST